MTLPTYPSRKSLCKPYITWITWGINWVNKSPRISCREHQLNTIGTLLGVHSSLSLDVDVQGNSFDADFLLDDRSGGFAGSLSGRTSTQIGSMYSLEFKSAPKNDISQDFLIVNPY